jgi:hypothetical protein
MHNEALYFPTIELPRDEWLRRTLLYWDVVGSIIPKPHLSAGAVSPYMTALMDAGLVRAVDPEEQLWHLTDFDGAFFAFLDADPAVQRDLGRDPIRPDGPIVRVRT